MERNKKNKIDLVYCWVNGNDENWQIKKNKYLSELKEDQSNNNCRFIDNNELKYSLRSVEKYAPWINHIYIITDNQVPDWLNTNHPQISIIDHKEILPPEALPTFNSLAIESCMHKIPGLSEYFLYGNDDCFFSDYVTPDFFYSRDGKPYCRFRKKIEGEPITQYMNILLNCVNILEKRGYKFPLYIPHHNFDAYKKSIIEECYEKFEEELKQTTTDKFRTSNDVMRTIYDFYAIAEGKGIFMKTQKYSKLLPWYKKFFFKILKQYHKDSVVIFANYSQIQEKIDKLRPKLLCINDGEKTQDEDRIIVGQFLKSYFPQKCSFEK